MLSLYARRPRRVRVAIEATRGAGPGGPGRSDLGRVGRRARAHSSAGRSLLTREVASRGAGAMDGPPRAGHYRVIYADPPWRFATYSDKGKGRSAEAHYDCLSLDEIKRFPVSALGRAGCGAAALGDRPLAAARARGDRSLALHLQDRRLLLGQAQQGEGAAGCRANGRCWPSATSSPGSASGPGPTPRSACWRRAAIPSGAPATCRGC